LEVKKSKRSPLGWKKAWKTRKKKKKKNRRDGRTRIRKTVLFFEKEAIDLQLGETKVLLLKRRAGRGRMTCSKEEPCILGVQEKKEGSLLCSDKKKEKPAQKRKNARQKKGKTPARYGETKKKRP